MEPYFTLAPCDLGQKKNTADEQDPSSQFSGKIFHTPKHFSLGVFGCMLTQNYCKAGLINLVRKAAEPELPDGFFSGR